MTRTRLLGTRCPSPFVIHFQAAFSGEVIICWKMEDGVSRLLLNVGIFVPDYAASHLELLIFTNVKFSDSSEVVSTAYIKKELELGFYINRKTHSCVRRLI